MSWHREASVVGMVGGGDSPRLVPIGPHADLVANRTYRFSFCEGGGSASFDTALRVFRNTGGCPQIAANNNFGIFTYPRNSPFGFNGRYAYFRTSYVF